MGYRTRIGKISIKAYEKYKNMESEEEVQKAAGLKENEGVYRCLPEFTELYELGKYVDYSEGTISFFKFKLEDCEFQIASKEWLESVIEIYRLKVYNYYSMLCKAITTNKGTEEPVEKLTLNKEIDFEAEEIPALELFGHINKKKALWEGKFVKPYILENNPKYLTHDWSYEYSIFNLLYILKTFNWKKNLLIYNGW